MQIILKNGTFIDWESLEFSTINLLVETGKAGKIIKLDGDPVVEGAYLVLDCTGMYVTKSFAIGHHHVYAALARGMPPPTVTPNNFFEILSHIWWVLDSALDKETIRASALATAVASAKAGTSFVIDHHASPNCIEESLWIIADAFEEVGLSHLLCYEVTDRYGSKKAKKGLDISKDYLEKNQGLVGIHASFTVGEDTLKSAGKLMEKTNSGIHIHVAEDLYDQELCMDNYNKRVVERLAEHGVLESPKTILGHCLHLNDHERRLIRDSKAWIVQNMESNLKNKVGHFNGAGLGDRIMLGTDGMHSNMIRSAQAAFFAGQKTDVIDYQKAYDRFTNVHRYIRENSFAGDEENNLVVFNYPSPTPLNKENFLGHFIFGFSANDVRHVISNGKLIVKDKVLQTVNEKDVFDFTREQALRLWDQMEKIRN